MAHQQFVWASTLLLPDFHWEAVHPWVKSSRFAWKQNTLFCGPSLHFLFCCKKRGRSVVWPSLHGSHRQQCDLQAWPARRGEDCVYPHVLLLACLLVCATAICVARSSIGDVRLRGRWSTVCGHVRCLNQPLVSERTFTQGSGDGRLHTRLHSVWLPRRGLASGAWA